MLYIVKNSESNFFINEVLDKINTNLQALGIASTIAVDDFPGGKKARYLLVGHEFRTARNSYSFPKRKVLSRTINLVTEHPGSPWYGAATEISSLFPRHMFINQLSLTNYPSPHSQKYYFQLFNTSHEALDMFHLWSKRKFDLCFVGGLDSKRRRNLAEFRVTFSNRLSQIFCPETIEAQSEPRKDQLSAKGFDDLLRDTKAIINFHRHGTNNIEWPRLLKAIENGTAFISEPPNEFELKEFQDLFKSFTDMETLEEEIRDPMKLYEHIRNSQDLGLALKERNDVDILSKFILESRSFYFGLVPWKVREPKKAAQNVLRKIGGSILRKINASKFSFPEYYQVFWVLDHLRRSQKSLYLANIDLQRRIEQLKTGLSSQEISQIVESTPLGEKKIEISIAIPCFREGILIERCIDSILENDIGVPIEIIVCSDAGDESTINFANQKLQKSNIPFRILRRTHNGGVGANRNTMIEYARGAYVLMLDADNVMLPNGLMNLHQALSSDPNAFFSYGMLAIIEDGVPKDLMSSRDWDKSLFGEIGNYIDALTLIRKDKLIAIGGYSESLTLYGYEDFDLWSRVAESEGYGVLVRNFCAEYHRRGGSMVTITNIDHTDALHEIRRRSPGIFRDKQAGN